MNDEILIELVRQNSVLYDFEHSKYGDNHYKEHTWMAIANELNTAGSVCKSRWNQLRDQWRKSKKKNITKYERSGKPRKKWRYEEEMSFLEPFSRPRDAIDKFNESNNEETSGQDSSTVIDTKENIEEAIDNISATESEPTPTSSKRQKLSFSVNKHKESSRDKGQTASSVLTKYLIQKKENEKEDRTKLKDPTDIFFQSITEKVKRFSPYYRNLAESKIFSLVQEMELEQILQQEKQPQPQKRVSDCGGRKGTRSKI